MDYNINDQNLTNNHHDDKIATALALFQSECCAVTKDKKNPMGWKYAGLSSIIKTIQAPMKNAGLSFTQLISGDGKKVEVTTVIMHSSGQTLTTTIGADVTENKNGRMSPIQAMGAVITYLKRYSLSSILGIDKKNSKKNKYENVSNENEGDIQININPEKIAFEALKKATTLDELKEIYKSLGTQKGNPFIIAEKDRLKQKLS